MSCNLGIMAGIALICCACLCGAMGNRVLNNMKIGDSEVGSTGRLDMESHYLFFLLCIILILYKRFFK